MRYLILLFSFFSASVFAEAYCGLRDPVAMIGKLYPGYDSYRSIVRTVDADTRGLVSEQLPGMPLHFGELGRHTLYVIQKQGEPIGIVHVRSEQSNWGLVEIAWAINLDMTIKDFAFQRCRSRERKELEKLSTKFHFIGKDLDGLKGYFDFDRDAVKPAFYRELGSGSQLSEVVLRCAMKTLLVTQIVWQEELALLTSS